MNHSTTRAIALAGLLAIAAACSDDDDDTPAETGTQFSATLSGSEEVPPVPTEASGTAVFSIANNQITYTINVSGLTNPVVSHIHIGAEGENGPVRLNLCGTGAPVPPCGAGDGVLVTGTNGTTVGSPPITFEDLVAAMQAGETYVNVHTDDGTPPQNTGAGDMANGEIRGQIVPE